METSSSNFIPKSACTVASLDSSRQLATKVQTAGAPQLPADYRAAARCAAVRMEVVYRSAGDGALSQAAGAPMA